MTILAQIDENWLRAMVEDINNGAITIRDAIKGAKLKDSSETIDLSIGTFYRAIERHELEIKRGRGRKSDINKNDLKSHLEKYRQKGIVVGVTKMYWILKQSNTTIPFSYDAIRGIYKEEKWTEPIKPTRPLNDRCRYEFTAPNACWHVDVHYWKKVKGMYIYAAIDDYSRYCVGIEAVASKDAKTISECLRKFIEINGRLAIVWCDNGGENVGDLSV